jgi:hypothetical protein
MISPGTPTASNSVSAGSTVSGKPKSVTSGTWWPRRKGRAKSAGTITLTRNEILYGLNQEEKFRLAVVLVDENDGVNGPYYIRKPFGQEPDWGVASVNYDLNELIAKAQRFC